MTRYTSDGLLIFQFTMVGLLYLKSVIPAATAILPLIIFTVWFKVKLNRLFQHRSKHPYIGKFDNVTSGHLQEKEKRRITGWWWKHVDDIWKFSFIKDWWAAGRYAQHSCNNQSIMHLSTLEQSINPNTQSDITTVVTLIPNKLSKEEDSNSSIDCIESVDDDQDISSMNSNSIITIDHDNTTAHLVGLTIYPDDSKSVHETYQHPTLIEPLVTDLILPVNPNLHYWNLKECVIVPIDKIRSIIYKEF